VLDTMEGVNVEKAGSGGTPERGTNQNPYEAGGRGVGVEDWGKKKKKGDEGDGWNFERTR